MTFAASHRGALVTRRGFLTTTALGAVAGAAGCNRPEHDGSSPETRRNIRAEVIEVMVSRPGARFTENVYILYDARSRDAVIIDPGAVDSRIDAFVGSLRLRVRAILNTHGHWDHIGANTHYAERFNVPVWAHRQDSALFDTDRENGPTAFFDGSLPEHFSTIPLQVIRTPGHTEGSVCFHIDDLLFAGDTLFRESIGRTFGNSAELRRRQRAQEVRSIRDELLVLPDQTQVLPGHGARTTIGHERSHNPHLTS